MYLVWKQLKTIYTCNIERRVGNAMLLQPHRKDVIMNWVSRMKILFVAAGFVVMCALPSWAQMGDFGDMEDMKKTRQREDEGTA